MFDPFRKHTVQEAIGEIKEYEFDTAIYGHFDANEVMEKINDDKQVMPPKCVFIPGRTVVRKMIKALIRYGNLEKRDEFFMRFGLVEDP